jgi:hypothetical protein
MRKQAMFFSSRIIPGLIISLFFASYQPASSMADSLKRELKNDERYQREYNQQERGRSQQPPSGHSRGESRYPPAEQYNRYDDEGVKKQYRQREQPRKDRVPPASSRDGRDRRSEQGDRRDRPPVGTGHSHSTPPRTAERQSRIRNTHERHYRHYAPRLRVDRHYRPHETYHYHTHYLAPIRVHYHPIGYRVSVLPSSYIRIYVGSYPYFYFSGVFYRSYSGGYIVVRAPIGAVISVLPIGFIEFYLGGVTYYYVNDTYYIWDEARLAYIVVEKPNGAESAIAEATEGRLFAYPKQGQTEEQQARDRYECHRWAVRESRVDPTVDDEGSITRRDRDNYRRALAACLEGRGYAVK